MVLNMFLHESQKSAADKKKRLQFEYHQQSLAYLQRKLNEMQKEDKPISPNGNGQIGHIGHSGHGDLVDRENFETGLDSKSKEWTSSSVRIEHQPPKLGVEGSNPSSPAINSQTSAKDNPAIPLPLNFRLKNKPRTHSKNQAPKMTIVEKGGCFTTIRLGSTKPNVLSCVVVDCEVDFKVAWEAVPRARNNA